MIVFEVLGYSKFYPKIRFPLPDNNFLEPDFLLLGLDGLYEIFELKTPQEKLSSNKLHREKFRAKIEEYISQVNNYSEYFDDSSNQELVSTRYGIYINKHPNMIIIAGRDAGVNKSELHQLLHRRVGSLKIFTYDDILSRLKFALASSDNTENLTGVTLVMILTLHQVKVDETTIHF